MPVSRTHAALVAALGLCAVSPSAHAAPEYPAHAAMRGFGDVNVTNRVYGTAADRSSWITFAAEDPSHAAVVGSKFKADLLGFGDLKAKAGTGLPGTVVALDGTGMWLIGLNGSNAEVLFARSQAVLASLAKTANAASWKPVADRAYPRWLDCFDNAGTGIWWGGGGAPTSLPSDFQWAKDRGFTLTDQPPTEGRYAAPGVIDNSITDWFSAMCAKYDVPYRTLLWVQKPRWAWNRTPLPYIHPTGFAVTEPNLREATWSVYDSFEPVPGTEKYTADFRKQFAANLNSDPNYLGGHALGEVPDAGIQELGTIGGSAEVKALWHSYLVEQIGPDLQRIGRMHKGSAEAYASWDDVAVPSPADFIGYDSSSINLVGTWSGMPDRAKVGGASKWYTPDGAPKAGWTPIDCNDPILLMYGGGAGPKQPDKFADYWLKRTFTVTADQFADLKYLHVVRAMAHGSWTTYCDAYINGQPLAEASKPQGHDITLCYDVSKALQVGENTITLCMHGGPPAGLIALTGTPLRHYPFMTDPENRLWYDGTNFSAWLRMRNLTNILEATRAADPDRPLKVMATINLLDMSQDICAKYGAYQHDTGGAGGYWAPMTGARLARTHGLPWSCEQGGPPADVAAMQGAMTFYLMYGNDAVDLVFGVTHYKDNKPVADWVDHNNALMHCIGKLDMPLPPVGILRSTRATRLGYADPWNWDLGRGILQGVGRNFSYVEVPDIKSGVISQFPVVIDDGTVMMTEDECQGIINYVRSGGTFIAQFDTARDTPERANTWPLATALGLTVQSKLVTEENYNQWPLGKIKFADNEELLPSLRGKTCEGSGVAIDYTKQIHSGALSFAATSKDVRPVGYWEDGTMAAADIHLGRGRLIYLGTPFYSRMRDQSGMWVNDDDRQALLDDMLTNLGVPRDSWTGNRDIWAEHWLSKNGVYDLYPTARMARKVDPVNTTVSLRRDTPVKDLVEMTADGHPHVAVTAAKGRVTLAPAEYTAMQTRIYAAPRADVETAAMQWFAVQSRHWRALPPLSPITRPEPVPVPEDIVPLAEGWKLSTTQTDQAWVQPGFADASWKTVRLGSFAALGLPDEAIVQVRKEIAVPDSWKGLRVNLVFDSEWSYGIDRGKLYVNGVPAMGGQVLRDYGNSAFSIDVTDQAATGKVTLALDLDGHLAKPTDNRGRPAGVTGIFYLQAMTKPIATGPMPNPWLAATDANVLAPIDPKVRYNYLETRFTLPKIWPAKRLFLDSPSTLGALFVNGHLIDTPGWMNQLDISGMVTATGDNVIRWAPRGANNFTFNVTNNDPAPKIALSWMP